MPIPALSPRLMAGIQLPVFSNGQHAYAVGGASIPTRMIDRNTPLEDITLEQFLLIHGEQPVKKFVQHREIGPPRSLGEIRAAGGRDFREGEVEYLPGAQVSAPPRSRSVGVARGAALPRDPFPVAPNGAVVERGLPSRSTPESSSASASARPRARLAVPLGVTPTDPGDTRLVAQPCRNTIELAVDVENLGLVLWPVECEIVGDHLGSPHMTRIEGQDPDRPAARLDIFVGWADVLR